MASPKMNFAQRPRRRSSTDPDTILEKPRDPFARLFYWALASHTVQELQSQRLRIISALFDEGVEMAALGLDFGTSNTAAAVTVNGKPWVIPLEDGASTLPTAVFLDFGSGEMLFGQAAARAMTGGTEGRFMRSLKSILGTPLAQEKRQFLNQKMTLIEVIGLFLMEIKTRAEASTYQTYDHVVSGRPVRFHSASEERNAQALIDLEEAYHLAGFKSVSFLAEPEAAALAVGGHGRLLIVDIGGGTSDFTVCDKDENGMRVLASQGIRLGGTDFDRALSLAHVMPLLGYGATIGNEIGAGGHTAPRSVFQDLATWEKITFVYGPQLLRDVRKWERLAEEPQLFARLAEVLEAHLGHDLAYAVEAGKIAANTDQTGRINLGFVEKALSVTLGVEDIPRDLGSFGAEISDCALETVRMAGVPPQTIDRVVYVGGSSMMNIVRNNVVTVFPHAKSETSEIFTAVAHGLAMAAERYTKGN